jgi:hypothetical protein
MRSSARSTKASSLLGPPPRRALTLAAFLAAPAGYDGSLEDWALDTARARRMVKLGG